MFSCEGFRLQLGGKAAVRFLCCFITTLKSYEIIVFVCEGCFLHVQRNESINQHLKSAGYPPNVLFAVLLKPCVPTKQSNGLKFSYLAFQKKHDQRFCFRFYLL